MKGWLVPIGCFIMGISLLGGAIAQSPHFGGGGYPGGPDLFALVDYEDHEHPLKGVYSAEECFRRTSKVAHCFALVSETSTTTNLLGHVKPCAFLDDVLVCWRDD